MEKSSQGPEERRKETLRPRNEEYARKLRDVRWQQMRLRVFERDAWNCTVCFTQREGISLHAHHVYYKPGADPWDYPMEAVVTMCESCHEQETVERRQAEHDLVKVLREKGVSACDLKWLTSHVECAEYVIRPSMLIFAFGWILGDRNLQQFVTDLVTEQL